MPKKKLFLRQVKPEIDVNSKEKLQVEFKKMQKKQTTRRDKTYMQAYDGAEMYLKSLNKQFVIYLNQLNEYGLSAKVTEECLNRIIIVLSEYKNLVNFLDKRINEVDSKKTDFKSKYKPSDFVWIEDCKKTLKANEESLRDLLKKKYKNIETKLHYNNKNNVQNDKELKELVKIKETLEDIAKNHLSNLSQSSVRNDLDETLAKIMDTNYYNNHGNSIYINNLKSITNQVRIAPMIDAINHGIIYKVDNNLINVMMKGGTAKKPSSNNVVFEVVKEIEDDIKKINAAHIILKAETWYRDKFIRNKNANSLLYHFEKDQAMGAVRQLYNDAKSEFKKEIFQRMYDSFCNLHLQKSIYEQKYFSEDLRTLDKKSFISKINNLKKSIDVKLKYLCENGYLSKDAVEKFNNSYKANLYNNIVNNAFEKPRITIDALSEKKKNNKTNNKTSKITIVAKSNSRSKK